MIWLITNDLVLVLDIGQKCVLIFSPLQMCALNIKVMVTMFARVVFIWLQWWRSGSSAFPVPSPLGVWCELVVEVGQVTRGGQKERFRMIDFQFVAPAMVAMSIQ